MLVGTCAVLCLPQLPAWSLLALFVAACALASCLAKFRWVAGLGLGALLCTWQMHVRLQDKLDPALEGPALRIRGTVVSVPQGTLEVLKFRFAPEPQPGLRLPQLVELTWYDAPERVDAAETLELDVKLRRPRGFANPGGMDNEARMLREGIGASGYVRSGVRLGRAPGAMIRHPVLVARAHVARAVRDLLGERPAAGIVAGLSVGLQDALSREQWLALARSGTSHLMAISGLHIAMVAAMAAWAGGRLQRLRQRYRGAVLAQRDAAVIAGTGAAFCYSLLAGWSVPTQRTMVMIACGALALLLRRRLGVADGLGLCIAGVLLIDPLAPLAPGFWLSFGAVAVILFGASGYVRKPRMLHGYLQVQFVVTLGLVPVLAGSFGSVSLVSALVNLYAIPLYTLLVVPAVLCSCAVAVAWPAAGGVVLGWTGALIEFTWPLIAIPAGWPLATWSIAGLDAFAWAALVLGTLAAIAPLPFPGRTAGVVMILTACLWRPAPVPAGAARVSVLDVGQGLAVVVETRRHTLVYDAGPSFRTGSDTGQLVIAPFLRERGIRQLDMLVVSHDDDDHKGGAGSVLALVPTRRLVTGPGVAPQVMKIPQATWTHVVCRRGERWAWDGVAFEWVHPGPGEYERDNDSSCVLRVAAGGHSLLLTGDVEAIAEQQMLDAGLVGPVDIVVAPHHGSRTSSTAAFVEATRPRWVVYAAGYRNRWNFPVPRVVERWRAAGAADVRTGSGGAIIFDLRPGERIAPPVQWRRTRRHPWRDP